MAGDKAPAAGELPEGHVLVHTVFRPAGFIVPADEADVLRKRGLTREVTPEEAADLVRRGEVPREWRAPGAPSSGPPPGAPPGPETAPQPAAPVKAAKKETA